MKSKELSIELRDRIVSRYRWKKVGTTKALPRAGYPAKLSNRGRRALIREVTKNPMATMSELQKFNHLCSTPPIWPLW
jgi:hypothetical protein